MTIDFGPLKPYPPVFGDAPNVAEAYELNKIRMSRGIKATFEMLQAGIPDIEGAYVRLALWYFENNRLVEILAADEALFRPGDSGYYEFKPPTPDHEYVVGMLLEVASPNGRGRPEGLLYKRTFTAGSHSPDIIGFSAGPNKNKVLMTIDQYEISLPEE